MAKVRLKIAPSLVGLAWRAGSELPIVSSHRHAELELNLVLRGSATYLFPGRRDHLVRRSIVWLWPSQDHILIDRSQDFDIWVIVFRPALVRRHRQLAERSSLYSRRLSEGNTVWLDRILSSVVEATTTAEQNVGLEFALLQAWGLYVAAEQSLLQEVHPAVERAALRIRDDPGLDSVDELASAVGLSPSRLGRVFKAQMGVSLLDYRNQLRLERFLHLHGPGGRHSVTQSLFEAGFGSQAQFYRAFRAAFGTSPYRYLRGESTPRERITPSDERRDNKAKPRFEANSH
jgi:AraC-like DNA-binding protein